MERREFLKTVGAGSALLALPGELWSALSGLTEEQIEERVKETLAQLTLDEKISLMAGHLQQMLLRFLGGRLERHGYTGYTLGNERLGVPQIKCLDGPRGVGFLYKTTCFPVSMCRGSTWDRALEERVGAAMGYETRALGANMLLAPCINVLWHPRWGRAQETYGEDPCHLGVMGAGFVVGLQKHVMACAKHYAVNNTEDNRTEVNAKVKERVLREIFLPHFQRCVEAKTASIMSAYNDVNGYLCGQNKHLLRDVLKGDWKFDGFVVSDWGAAVDDAVAAANAGLDLEMPKDDHFGKPLKSALAAGQVPVAAVDEAVTRMMRQLFRFVGPDFEKGYDPQKIAGPEHAALAREVARKGLVLLKNENGVLPLDRQKIKTLAVIGELAEMENIGDHGSSRVTPPYAVSALEGLTKLLGAGVKIEFDPGKDLDRVRKLASQADAALVFAGLTYKDEGEGHDRKGLPLSAEHALMIIAAAGANPKCAVVLVGGSALTMASWKDKVPAIVMAWYPGMEGGHAVAEVLMGEVNPSGKLPIVFPASEDQLDKFDNQSKEVAYGDYHGYRKLEKKGLEPLFPFGFGLSYTKYQYSNLKLESVAVPPGGKLAVAVDVKNIGDRAGEEIVQLYVAPPGRAVDRAPKELQAFARAALGPGEAKTVSLAVAAQDLAYYDEAAGDWKIEPGDYTVLVGPSSRNADLLTAAFKTG